MSATDSETAPDPRPDWFVHLLGYPDIYVTCVPARTPGKSQVEYDGWADDLLAAGVAQPEWAQPTGKHLRDADNDRVTVIRSYRECDGQPRRHFCVQRIKSKIESLPAAVEARAAWQAYEAWRERRWPGERTQAQSRPTLRLVVDNTQAKTK